MVLHLYLEPYSFTVGMTNCVQSLKVCTATSFLDKEGMLNRKRACSLSQVIGELLQSPGTDKGIMNPSLILGSSLRSQVPCPVSHSKRVSGRKFCEKPYCKPQEGPDEPRV